MHAHAAVVIVSYILLFVIVALCFAGCIAVGLYRGRVGGACVGLVSVLVATSWLFPAALWLASNPLSPCSMHWLQSSRAHGSVNAQGEWEGIWCQRACADAQVIYAQHRAHIARVLIASGARSIRVVGSGHSMEELQCPDRDGIVLVVADALCDSEGMRISSRPVDGETLATLSAGCTVREAQKFLLASGLQLKGFGAVLEQRIGGALATNLHGLHLEAFASHLRGVEAVLADGSTVVVGPDDPALRAWSGSVGSLGVVVTATMRVWPIEYATCTVEEVRGSAVDVALQSALREGNLVGFSAEAVLGSKRHDDRAMQLRRCVSTADEVDTVEMPSFEDSVHWATIAGMEYWGMSALTLWSTWWSSVVYRAIRMPYESTSGPTALLFLKPGNYNPHPDQEYAVPIERCVEALQDFRVLARGV